MKFNHKIIVAFVVLGLAYSCFNDNDDNGIFASEINDFVWKGMNAVYLYKDNIPDLDDDRFSSDQEYGDYLNSFAAPEDLFESLIYQRQTVDKYSRIFEDYIALEQLLSGVSKKNGMEFNLYFEPGSESNIFGIIRLILPNSEAAGQNLLRGQVFDGVDGVSLTLSNYQDFLFSDSDTYSIDLATYDDNDTPQIDDDLITSGSESVSLTKQPYTENPVFRTEIIDVDGENVGYLMYNGFTSDYNSQLNAAFGTFLANNVQHLVLDVRYNPGGSVNTATLLGSMITGQFNGQLFSSLEYNSDLQAANTDFNFTNTLGSNDALNSLNLDKVYVLATGSSASASEMVINSLKPYIDVIHIGTTTEGKTQASVTIYDSPDLGRNGANPNHTYAMQPLVAIASNKNSITVPSSGIIPTLEFSESPSNYGVLGDETEPLLARAIDHIRNGSGIFVPYIEPLEYIGGSHDEHPLNKNMYIEIDLPEGLRSTLKIND